MALRHELLNLPNFLTYIRVAIIPAIVCLLLPPSSPESMNLAFWLFIFASITDYLDGILARRRNSVTSVGVLLDPLADKLLTSAVLIMLIPVGKVQAWLVFLILGREIVITGLRFIAAGQGVIMNASRLGKNKMFSLTIAITLLLLNIDKYQYLLDGFGQFFLWVSLILGYWSATEYFLAFYRQFRRQQSS